MSGSGAPCPPPIPLTWETLERMHALEVKGQTVAPETLEALRQSLRATPIPTVIPFLARLARQPDTPEDQPAETYWAVVQRLQEEPTAAVFEEMARWSEHTDAGTRLAAIHVLGQLGYPRGNDTTESTYPFAQATAAIIERLLEDEALPVVCAALAAAGHLGVGDIERMKRFVDHPDPSVRFDLAFALLTRDEPEARETLIKLSTDEDAAVRDWATFGLGSQSDVDTPAIRDALVARLADSDPDTRGEAIKGLAKRKDKRVLPALIEVISAEACDAELPELAAAWADPALLPTLDGLQPKTHLALSSCAGDGGWRAG